jgi:hypothetical protein
MGLSFHLKLEINLKLGTLEVASGLCSLDFTLKLPDLLLHRLLIGMWHC